MTFCGEIDGRSFVLVFGDDVVEVDQIQRVGVQMGEDQELISFGCVGQDGRSKGAWVGESQGTGCRGAD